VQEFYTNPQIVSDFKAYVKHLLTHRNPYTGLTYAEDPTIAMFETGNELSGPKFGDMDVPVQWTRDMARYIKSLAPHTLIVDGTYGVNKTHLAIPEIDIFSDHFYPLNLTKLNADIELVGGVDRVYLAGEIDWTEKSTRTNVTLRQFFDVIEARQSLKEPVVAGTSFWSLFGRDGPDCSVSSLLLGFFFISPVLHLPVLRTVI
jgi:mannan endo-1,4-beta-mannosidase